MRFEFFEGGQAPFGAMSCRYNGPPYAPTPDAGQSPATPRKRQLEAQ